MESFTCVCVHARSLLNIHHWMYGVQRFVIVLWICIFSHLLTERVGINPKSMNHIKLAEHIQTCDLCSLSLFLFLFGFSSIHWLSFIEFCTVHILFRTRVWIVYSCFFLLSYWKIADSLPYEMLNSLAKCVVDFFIVSISIIFHAHAMNWFNWLYFCSRAA